MEPVFYSDYKKGWSLMVLLLIAAGCASSDNARDVQEPVIRPEVHSDDTDREEQSLESQVLELTYQNESTSIRMPIDLNSQNIYLELRGKAREEKKEPEPEERAEPGQNDESASNEQADRIRNVMSEFVKAQNEFYRGNYEESMEAVNRSLNIERTADALALKGTIYFMLGNSNEAQRFWTRAMRLNPDLPVPDINELEDLIEEIDLEEDGGNNGNENDN